MASFQTQANLTQMMLTASPAWQRVCELSEEADNEMLSAMLTSAAEMADELVAPSNSAGDLVGCTVTDGRVKVPQAFHEVWQQYCEAGWIGADLPAEEGGLGLPLAMQSGTQMLFDRANLAFCMLPGSTRCAAFVLAEYADAETKSVWVPDMLEGKRSATICISEADAGSDLARVRTSAEQTEEGQWRVTGRKNWISYGDHDLTEDIAHMLLARTGTKESGTRGLSLFLVPNRTSQTGDQNVSLERIEEKLGLHGSPTCVLNFDSAEAILIGEEGRGLPQLFVMIERMRLLTASQGCGVAHAAFDIAAQYARERTQGGPPDAPPLPIIEHPDVQRQLAEMASRVLTLHAFFLELSTFLDLARLEADEKVQADYRALVGFLLPIAKNFGGEAGFDCASRAIQVLGGAGYTREWPLEQLLRDTRILTIFEGTTGMQALDVMHRRLWREQGHGLSLFATRMRAEIERARDHALEPAGQAETVLRQFEALSEQFEQRKNAARDAEYGANAFFEAAWCAVSAWMALRLINLATTDEGGGDQLAAAGRLRIQEALIEMVAAVGRANLMPEHISAAGTIET